MQKRPKQPYMIWKNNKIRHVDYQTFLEWNHTFKKKNFYYRKFYINNDTYTLSQSYSDVYRQELEIQKPFILFYTQTTELSRNEDKLEVQETHEHHHFDHPDKQYFFRADLALELETKQKQWEQQKPPAVYTPKQSPILQNPAIRFMIWENNTINLVDHTAWLKWWKKNEYHYTSSHNFNINGVSHSLNAIYVEEYYHFHQTQKPFTLKHSLSFDRVNTPEKISYKTLVTTYRFDNPRELFILRNKLLIELENKSTPSVIQETSDRHWLSES